MSLYLPNSKFVDSSEAAVAPGAVIQVEGLALVRAPGAPASGVMQSMAADATEIFAGFSIAGVSAAPFVSPYANKVENFTIGSAGTAVLGLTPVAGQIMVYDNTTGAKVAISGGVSLTGKVLAGLTNGHSVTVTYKYALSVLQALALEGNQQPGGFAGAQVGQIGVIKRGVIYTSEFDASVNWAAATGIKLAANGQVTDQTGSGATIIGYVVAAPNSDCPYLGLEFSAA